MTREAPTVVVFRVWRGVGTVLALFPRELERDGMCGSYEHIGQHGSIKRVAVLADVQALERRKPDKQDRDAITNGSYVVVEIGGKEALYHQAFLKADRGSVEISEAIAALKAAP
jgi:hypothetical protein